MTDDATPKTPTEHDAPVFAAVQNEAEDAADAVRLVRPEVVGEGRVQAWVVGPGAGDEAAAALSAALADGVPVVVDADALAGVDGPFAVPTVLTPHAGELAAMLGVTRDEIEARPLAHARAAAARFDAVVVLKGARTLVASGPEGSVLAICDRGNPGMATAGMGDVLTGVITALRAQIDDSGAAARVGVRVHAVAGDAAARGGQRGLIASDVINELRRWVNP